MVQKQEGEEAEEAKCCQKVEKENSQFQIPSAWIEEQNHGFFHQSGNTQSIQGQRTRLTTHAQEHGCPQIKMAAGSAGTKAKGWKLKEARRLRVSQGQERVPTESLMCVNSPG